jgi:uncharacterized lipoprotein
MTKTSFFKPNLKTVAILATIFGIAGCSVFSKQVAQVKVSFYQVQQNAVEQRY